MKSSLSVVCGGLSLAFLLCGCAQKEGTGSAALPLSAKHGRVHGGLQPVTGAAIQLYAAGTTGDGLAATALLTVPVTTDATGSFDLNGDFTCPSPNSLLYLVGTGGNPGLAAGLSNPQLTMMTVVGQCSSLTASTYIEINELTTVAAVWALAPFMISYSGVGSGASDAPALASAFALAAEYVNTATGTIPGAKVPAGTAVPVAEIDTLANILASCVNSTGGVAGDGSTCGTLFTAATPAGGTAPANVVGAAINIASNPTANVATLFGLMPATAPYQPVLASAPSDLMIRLMASGLSVSPSVLTLPNTTILFSSAEQTVTVSNNGTRPYAFGSISIIGANASDFGEVDTCTELGSLAPTASCVVQIEFTPSAAGERDATLLIASNESSSPLAVPLSGIGLADGGGAISLSPSVLNFTQAGVPQNITVTNNGSSPVVIGSISGSATVTNNCGAMLAAQSICTIAASADTIGQIPLSGKLSVISDSVSGTQMVAINIAAAPSPVTSFSTESVDFGSWAVGVTSVIEPLQNLMASSSSYTLFASLTGPNAADFSIPSSEFLYQANQYGCFHNACQSFVAFTPSGPGLRTATLETALGNVQLSGTGLPAGPAFSVAPFLIQNQPVGSGSYPFDLYITNTGSTALSLSGVAVTGANAGDFAVTGQCATIQPASMCTSLAIVFTPSQLGPRTATLTLTDSISGFSEPIPLTGVGETSSPTATPSPVIFANTDIGSVSAPQVVTISTPYGDPVTLTLVGSKDYVLSPNTCATQTPCQLTVTFQPTVTGPDSAVVSMTDLYDNTYGQIPLEGNGGIATVSLSVPSLMFTARDEGTTSISQVVTLTNTGDISLSISEITLSGANVGDFPIENNTCAYRLAPGASCAVSVSFAPSASGSRSANLVILTNAASSPDTVSLSGTGN